MPSQEDEVETAIGRIRFIPAFFHSDSGLRRSVHAVGLAAENFGRLAADLDDLCPKLRQQALKIGVEHGGVIDGDRLDHPAILFATKAKAVFPSTINQHL